MTDDNKTLINMSIGYVLILAGVVVMCLSVFEVYKVFTKKSQPYEFFNFESIKLDITQLVPKSPVGDLGEISKSLGIPQNLLPSKQSTTSPTVPQAEILPAEVLNGPANLGVYLLFMGFLLNFGFRIAGLGVSLVQTVYVRPSKSG